MLLAQLDARELIHWRIMYRLGAFGSRVEDYRAGVIASSAGNAPRFAKSNGEQWAPSDYFRNLGPRRSVEDRRRQTASNLREWRRYWTRS